MPRVMARLHPKRNKKHPQVSTTMSAVCLCPMTKKASKKNTSRKEQETWSITTLYLNVQHHRCRISISRRACTPARGALPTLEYHTQKTRGLISGEPTARFSPKFVFDGRSNFGTRTTCSRGVQCAFKGQTMFLVRVRCRASTPQPHPMSQCEWACSLRCRDMETSVRALHTHVQPRTPNTHVTSACARVHLHCSVLSRPFTSPRCSARYLSRVPQATKQAWSTC